MKRTRIRQISRLEQYIMITIGVIVMASGFYFFLIPADLVAGGVTGLALVINKLVNQISISLFVLIMNLILLILGLFVLGKRVFLKSIYGSLLFPAVLFLFEEFLPLIDYNNDYIIVVVFGGALLGLGFGLVLKFGGTTGGTDIPVKIMNKKLKLPVSVSVYVIDGIVVLLGIIVFFEDYGLSIGFYAIIAIFISGNVADRVVVGSNSKKAVQIITDKPEEIKEAIYKTVIRGVTEVAIKGGYTRENKTMLVTVITRQEYYVIRNIIAMIDESAFVYVTPATEIHGDFFESESE